MSVKLPASNHLFEGIPKDVLTGASFPLEQRDYTASQKIFDEGETGNELFLIVRGTVHILKHAGEGKDEVLCRFGDNDFFGEMAVLDSAPRSAAAVAETACSLLVVSRETFDQILAINPPIVTRNLARTMVGRLRDFNERFMKEMLRQERFSLLGSMVAGIIHDFRNPISTILTACELVAMRSEDPKVEKYCGTIQRSVDRMTSMVQEMLDFSRGSLGDITLEEVEPAVLMRELEELGLDAMAAGGIAVEKEINVTDPLRIDLERVSRMLLNIIKNAAEAMAGSGSFRFSLERDGPEIVFRLQDTGPGMSPATVARLFEPFFTEGKKGGTGLGLAIAKMVVDAHRGSIRVNSKPGEGTMFEIRLPR